MPAKAAATEPSHQDERHRNKVDLRQNESVPSREADFGSCVGLNSNILAPEVCSAS